MPEKIKVTLQTGEVLEKEIGSTIKDILGAGNGPLDPVIAIVDGEVAELSKMIHYDVCIKPITLKTSLGRGTYMRSLIFLLIKAVNKIIPQARVTIEHSLGEGLYGEIHCDKALTEEDYKQIKNTMLEIVNCDYKFEKIKMKKDEAIKIFESYGMKDKLRLLNHIDLPYINLYKCGHMYNYFYGTMVPSTGYLKIFDLLPYNKDGFILRFPNICDPTKIPEFKDLPKLAKVFKETEDWAKILDASDVGALNEKVISNEIEDIILVSEALHEKKIAQIADKIYDNIDNIRMILIAGPSSSGKTTFSKRLSIQLKVLGLKPYAISLDDYFVDRERTPKDENGDYDFESIKALDVELFNKHLEDLINEKEIEIPRFNFINGQREWIGRKYKMSSDSILVIEGIHGLNEELTKLIERENKYKIYISALTQLNIDDHNRIPTTDVRILRRLVRDNMDRGRSAETTISTWPSVRAGEDKNIFPYQEEADIMFNSTLIYEMCVLKKYAEPLLKEIKINTPAYNEAKRLLMFLGYFKAAEEEIIPNTSIIREFIGNSCFYKK